MKIEENKVVSFHYALSEVDGEQLETSDPSEPMTYLYGHGNILAALETAMRDKQAGDKFEVSLSPAEAYGARQENAEQRIAIKHILTDGKKKPVLRPGMAVKVNTEKGPRDVRVIKVGKFNVDVDTNHPLAGRSLSFKLEVVDVRDATQEEIAHRHVHGTGGHHH
ncbi:MAG: FKBP-type peptidyl-prolyl cis-trans isomerase SlyD [Gammaproteobacteria bacterium]|jgi:FKBP-type peptidyl-prolyl cis-trans isomerase SlyD